MAMVQVTSYLDLLIVIAGVLILYGLTNFVSWLRLVGWFEKLGYKAFPWNWRVLVGRDVYYRWLLAHDEQEHPAGE